MRPPTILKLRKEKRQHHQPSKVRNIPLTKDDTDHYQKKKTSVKITPRPSERTVGQLDAKPC